MLDYSTLIGTDYKNRSFYIKVDKELHDHSILE